MKYQYLVFVLFLATQAFAVEPLTEAEQKQLAAVEITAKKTTAMRDATETFNALRKAYQLDRQKFPADRVPELAVRYRKGMALPS